ncbi:MAG: LptF/LptG family permease [Melioribacteraceae bacterium]|nr:LptF/LptG family permease [Melioribacteraceae bacterium]
MIIIKYILKNHLAPFLFSIFTLIAVFLLQFMMKFADRLVGKGLDTWIIIQLIIYNLAWMVVLVVPMAVLVATLMAFGSMSQNNEIAILKSSGVSLYKMMIPPIAASVVIALLLVYFNNNIYPDANHAARLLMEDISRKKPTLSLVPGLFSQEVPNYSILVREIDQNSNELKEVLIYDYTNPPKVNIVTATEGKIYLSKNQKKLIMDLVSGEIHESDNTKESIYRKLRFERHKIALPAEQFTFEQTAPGGPRGDRELGTPEMLKIVDSLTIIYNKNLADFNLRTMQVTFESLEKPIINIIPDSSKMYIYTKVQQRIKTDENSTFSFLNRIDYGKKEINRYWVEIHKKYSLPFACIVFVLIGAPLGTMMKRGGFGMAAGISLLFFLAYWSFLIGGEKFADRGLLSPFWGMWSANVLLTIVGIWLMIKSAREKITISFDFLSKLIPESWRTTENSNPNNED